MERLYGKLIHITRMSMAGYPIGFASAATRKRCRRNGQYRSQKDSSIAAWNAIQNSSAANAELKRSERYDGWWYCPKCGDKRCAGCGSVWERESEEDGQCPLCGCTSYKDMGEDK